MNNIDIVRLGYSLRAERLFIVFLLTRLYDSIVEKTDERLNIVVSRQAFVILSLIN